MGISISPEEDVMARPNVTYNTVKTSLGEVALVWQHFDGGPKIIRIFLPREDFHVVELVREYFATPLEMHDDEVKELSRNIMAVMEGVDVQFNLDLVKFDLCSSFQQEVLLMEKSIPWGKVSTYGKIARQIGSNRSARAVGMALSRNPFPVIIPCHRAVLSNLDLGGYQGGPKLKRLLLEKEGIRFDEEGKVLPDFVIFPPRKSGLVMETSPLGTYL